MHTVASSTPQTQTARALLALRELLLRGEFRPGTRLTELGLVSKLSASRTPVRHALTRLAHEGLLDALPAGGFRVRAFSLSEIWDAIEIRGVLEGTAARLAAERLTHPSDLAVLRASVAAIGEVMPQTLTAFMHYLDINEQFHAELRRLAKSPVLLRTMDAVLTLPFAGPSALVFGQIEPAHSARAAIIALEHHRGILEAIEQREGTRAEGLAREHSRVSRMNLARALENQTLFRRMPGASLIRMPAATSGRLVIPPMSQLVTLTTDDGVAIIEINNPPVNALSPGVPDGIMRAVDAAEADPAVAAIVVIGGGRTFVAGADITTLEQAAWGDDSALPNLHALLARLEDATKPVVMAIHGTALGGGLEMAMAGHFRVAVPEALIGQPEVNLGIIPGAEGTQRLPRLVGVEKALDLCVTGRPMKAPAALEAGLIDAVIDGDLLAGAVTFARGAEARGRRTKTRDRTDALGTAEANAPFYAQLRQVAAKVKRHQTAPLRAIEAIEIAATRPFDEGCRLERQIFSECVATEQAKALIHSFFAERAVAKVPGVGKDVAARPMARVAIVGAGTMGAGIAMACANAGLTVRMRDATQAAIDAGLGNIRRNYDTSVKRGRFTETQADERVGRIEGQLGYEGFDEADVVIEAVFESLDLKRRVFAELDGIVRPGALLGTNTSTLDIDAIAGATSRPGDVVGLHFFSPANVMRLLEIVRGGATSPETIATAFALGKRLGKVGVLAGNCPGFIGNRMMFPYMYETQFMAEEGATPEQIDRALTEFGMAMGMFAVDDMAGIDVAWRVRQELKHFSEPGGRRPLVADRLYEMGRLGQKTGKGWYRYDESRRAVPDPDVTSLIRTLAASAGVPQRTFTDDAIVERSIFALVNEGARVLDEGYALRASDIDVIYTSGYGFPAWRGGPMFYADRAGPSHVLATVRALEAEHGTRWTPAPLLVRLAETGGTFRGLDQTRRG